MAKKVIGDINFFDEDGDIIDRITYEQLSVDRIKDETDFLKLLEHFGIKVGKDKKALCPFHPDKNPSFSIYDNDKRFKCFGCGKSGDVFNFLEYYKGLKFKEALKFLNEYNGNHTSAKLGNHTNTSLVKSNELKLDLTNIDTTEQITTGDQIIPPLTSKLRKDEDKQTTTDTEPKSELETITVPFEDAGQVIDRQFLYQETVKRYHETLNNKEPVLYLEKRGLKNKNNHIRFKIGFCNRSLLNSLNNEQSETLKKYGLINKDGTEFFYGCLVFPIFDELENVVGFYGRDINDNSNFKHRYLKGKHRSVFNRKASKVYPDRLILTESIIDAMSLIELGFDNVQASYGIQGYTAEMLEIHKTDQVKEIIIAYDSDEAGRKGSESLKEKLVNENFQVRLIFPSKFKDWNEELIAGIKAETIKELIEKSEVFQQEKDKNATGGFEYELKQGTYYLKTDGLVYRVIGFNKTFTTELKVNIRVYRDELNTFKVLNLYNESALDSLTRNIAEELGVSGDTVRAHLKKIISFFEDERERLLNDSGAKQRVYILTSTEETRALDILTGSDLFSDHLFPDSEKMGLVGELTNKRACYLAVISRLTRRPINICTLSTYGTGKSFLHDTIHKLVPDEDLKSYARITKNDLYYREDENAFVGKVLSVDEIEGLGESLYSIRTLISSGVLSISYTSMNPETGKLGSRENKVIGRPSIFCTGTSDEIIDAETLSRFLLLTTDISNEQRFKIKQRQFYEMSLEGTREKRLVDEITSKHKNILRMIKKIEVVFPESWNKELKNLKDGDYSVRDNLCYLGFITSFAIKEQHTRKVYTDTDAKGTFPYIEASKNDVARANHIMREIFGKSLSDLTPPQRHFLKVVQDYASKMIKGKNLTMQDIAFYERDIRESSGLSAWQVNHYLNDLLKLEYIIPDGKSKHNRKSYRLEIGEHIDHLTESNTRYLAGLIDTAKI